MPNIVFMTRVVFFFSFQTQQVASTKKEMGLFSKGHVDMNVTTDKRAYAAGIKVPFHMLCFGVRVCACVCANTLLFVLGKYHLR